MKTAINIPKLYKDEYISSFVERLYKANGFENFNQFAESIGIKNKLKSYYYERIDNRVLYNFLELDSWADFFLKTTSYHFLAPLLTSEQQIKWLSCCFGLLPTRIVSKCPEYFKYCPECNKILFYARTFHNLPGVNVCPIHKCSLERNGISVLENVTQEDIDYAVYAKDFFDAKFDTDYVNFVNQIQVTSRKKETVESKLGYIRNKYKSVSDIVFKANKPSFETDEYDIAYSSNILVEAICKHCKTRFCTSAYGLNNAYLCPQCQSKLSKDELLQLHINATSNGEYTFVPGFKSYDVKIEFHHSCGQTIKMKPFSYLEGSRCTCEQHWDEYQIKNYLAKKHPDYRYIRKIDNYYCEFEHIACGKIFPKNWLQFLHRPDCCPKCNPYMWTEESVKAFVESKGYTYISGHRNEKKDFIMTIVCPNGHKKETNLKTFKENPACRECRHMRLRENSNKEKIYKYIVSNYDKEDLIFLDDLREALPDLDIPHGIKELLKSGNLFHLSHGIYSLKKDITIEEFATKMYLDERKGHKGFLAGKFNPSIVDARINPNKYYVYSNVLKPVDGRTIIYKGNKIIIHGIAKRFEHLIKKK